MASKRKRKQGAGRKPPGTTSRRGERVTPAPGHAGGYIAETTSRDDAALAMQAMGIPDETPVILAAGDAVPPAGSAGELLGTLNKPMQLGDGTVLPPGTRVYRGLRPLTNEEMGSEPRDTTITAGDLAGYTRRPGVPSAWAHLADDDQVGVIFQVGDGPPPPGAIELVGTTAVAGTLDDGTSIPAGTRVWRTADDYEPPAGEAQSTLRLGDLRQAVRSTPRSDDPAGTKVTVPIHTEPAGALIPAAWSGAANEGFLRAAESRQPPGSQFGTVPGSSLPGEVYRRLETAHPGITARLGRGLAPGELGSMAPQIARMMAEAGARPGSQYSFPGSAAPSVVITDDPDLVPDDADLVIEDRGEQLRFGRPAAFRSLREQAAMLDRRARHLLPAADTPGSQLIRTALAAEAIQLPGRQAADEVLGQHAWLTRHYRDPGDDLADFLAFLIRDCLAQDPRAVKHFWPVARADELADLPQGRDLARLIGRGLLDGLTYQVTAPMCAKMRATADQAGMIAYLDERELPAPAGFAWLDRPWLTYLAGDSAWIPVRAVSWERTAVPARDDETGLTAVVDCVRVVLWLLMADHVAFGFWEGNEDRVAKVVNWIGRMAPLEVVLLPFGRPITYGKHKANAEATMGLLHSLWMYLGMTLPKSRPVSAAAPAVRRQAARSGLKHDAVHVITLRQYELIGDPVPHFPKLVSWTCRWWVADFYRHIDPYEDYDDQGRQRKHKAVPASRVGAVRDDDHDICAVCEASGQAIRITPIRTYAKGPPGLPFRKPAPERTLYRLAR